MGTEVMLRALAWAMVMDGMHPTITLHGRNDPAFYSDYTADVPACQRVPM